MIYGQSDSRLTRYQFRHGAFAGEHAGREIPSFSSKTADIDLQHASMSCPIAPRQLCSVYIAVPDTAGCDLKVESMVTCRSLFSGSQLDTNAVIRD